MQRQQEKNPPEPSQSTEQSHPLNLRSVPKGHGTRVSHLRSWSDKAMKLMDKLMELADISYIMEKNDAPTDKNLLFSDELTKTAEILIDRGKVLLQKGARIKLARAQSIERAVLRKQEQLRG